MTVLYDFLISTYGHKTIRIKVTDGRPNKIVPYRFLAACALSASPI